ncbi:MAG: CoA pyrophosphatase [Acidobacteriota bacterium]
MTGSTPGGTPWFAQIVAALASPPPRRLAAREIREASVLVPLYVDAGELWVVLTKRTESLPSHKGQIAFPGGGRELGEDAWAAALREAQEEIGLDPALVLRLGMLDETDLPSGFRVRPCVGALPFPFETKPNPVEIADVFAIPLSAFSNPSLVEERAVLLDGRERMLRIYHIGGRQIWGATARILQNLLQRLGKSGVELDED